MKVLSILFLTMSVAASGQNGDKEIYKLYSDVLPQIFKTGTPREKILILDSTYLTQIPLEEPLKLIKNYTQVCYQEISNHYPFGLVLEAIWKDTTIYSLLLNHNRLNKNQTTVTDNFDKNIQVRLMDYEDLNNWDKINGHYPGYQGYNGLTIPSIKNNRAVFILTSIQSGFAGTGSLIICKRINKKWMIDTVINLWGT